MALNSMFLLPGLEPRRGWPSWGELLLVNAVGVPACFAVFVGLAFLEPRSPGDEGGEAPP